MTIRNRCVRCDKVIEAPDERRGEEVACPSCEATNVLRSDEETKLREVEDKLQSDRERDTFMTALASRQRPSGQTRRPPSDAGWHVPIESGTPGVAHLASRRLKDISVYLLGFAYLLPVLALGPAVVVALWGGLPGVWGVVSFLTGAFVSVLAFVFFKFMSDTVRALADVTDLALSLDSRLADVTQAVAGQGNEASEPAEYSSAAS